MLTMSELTKADINFTDSAARKVKVLIDEEQNPNLNLRVYVMGGGCSGFQYGFTFDEKIKDNDRQVEKQFGDEPGVPVVRLLVDSMSYQYLKGATIDYRTDVNGEQFVIKNPNAKTTCGCGSSFAA